MGGDLVKKAAPSFRKALDRGRIELGTPGLFTQEPAAQARSYAAHLADGKTTTKGEELGVHLHEEHVLVLRGLEAIGEIEAPPADLLTALQISFGDACARVVEVHDLAHVAEVVVC